MKKRIFKILGVAVTVAMVLTLAAAFSAAPASGAVEKLNEWYNFAYPEEGEDGDWFYSPYIDRIGEITQAINGDLYVYVEFDTPGDHIFKSEDGGRTWADTGYDDLEGECDTTTFSPGRVFDMVCSSIDEDVVYATDGCYVYKTDDGGDTWDFLGKDSLETVLVGQCGCCVCGDGNWRVITSLDVTYDEDDNPFVFIGTWRHGGDLPPANPSCYYGDTIPGDVYYIGEAGYPANWTSLNLACFHGGNYNAIAVGCAPNWAETKETYVVVTTPNDPSTGPVDPRTWVVYTKGTVCGWYEFAELLWDCKTGNNFESWAASRIAFPDDWEDSETLFVGITDRWECAVGTSTPPPIDAQGGDVYMATDGSAIDMNVAGITTGCQGKESVDIISLDIMGDADEASLIAGEYCCNNVWYSTDGGWSWDASEKDPTGERLTFVIFYEDTALAVTTGDECAVSMSCGEEVGQYWNQISLISTCIYCVIWGDHSPGYLSDDSHTLYILTWCGDKADARCQDQTTFLDTQSLFRYDGTYWERVFCSTIAGADFNPTADGAPGDTPDTDIFEWVEVSPDFLTTNCVYLGNSYFEVWRTLDAGCSWDKLSFPCAPRPRISAAVVMDEDTGLAGGAGSDVGTVFKTTRHGARPWSEYEVDTTYPVSSFALEPGYEDPGSVLLGTYGSEVFISEDGGETWDEVNDFATVVGGPAQTWVIFDPGYATNHIIYAAAGQVIARCIIDPDADWADQEWEELCDQLDVASGIAAAGDTALYVADDEEVEIDEVDGTGQFICTDGGVLRSLNPDAEDAEDVVFERIGPGLDDNDTELHGLLLTTDVSDEDCTENVLWSLEQYGAHPENIWVYEDTLAQPVVLDMPADDAKLTKTDQATLSWNELCDADCYEVSLWSYCPECPDQKLDVELCLDCEPVDTVACQPDTEIDCWEEERGWCCPCTEETCIVVDDLDPGTTYYWQVRVCQGKPTFSKWSEERTFTTAMMAVPFVDLCSPACGAQDIILTPNFAWGAVEGATGYEVELATTETFTAGVVTGETTVNAWVCPETLTYGTTYYWRVRAVKDGIYSDWTYCMFTTMPEPVEPTPPVVIEQVPPAAPPVINIPPAEMITPTWIYAIIGVGAALAIVVIVLIVRTRRPPA